MIGKLLRSARGEAGSHVTPVAFADSSGLLVGHNGDAWLWRVLPQQALHWEDLPARQAVARTLSELFTDLGRTSRGGVIPGTKIGSFSRAFHMVSIWWDKKIVVPDSATDALSEWLTPTFSRYGGYESVFAVGVPLRRSSPIQRGGLIGSLKTFIHDAMNSAPDAMLYAADRSRVAAILGKAGGRPPTENELRQLEHWWNGGRAENTMVTAEPDGKSISCDAWPEGIEISALVDYEKAVLDPRDGMWAAEGFGHADGCVAMSIRGELVPANAARDLMRTSRRKSKSRQSEQAATGDLEREEDFEMDDMATMMESVFAKEGQPLVRNCSVFFARQASAADETFADHLDGAWGLRVKPVEMRQVPVLEEMLPCSRQLIGRQKPFCHDTTVGFLAESGISAFARLGDSEGAWIGLTVPDMGPVWLDPLGSSKADRPPAMCVIGEPGAGKTFFLQLIATQASLLGRTTVFINPKPADSLDGFATAINGEVVKISAMEREGGRLDPFRYCGDPTVAADIAISHITAVLTDLPETDEVRMGAAIQRAAVAGARCVGDTLQHPDMPESARELIYAQVESSSLFALGISMSPVETQKIVQGALTLIEFDRPLDLPATVAPMSEYGRQTRISVAAIRLVIRSSLEQMFTLGGGVLIVDEAHVFMGSEEGRSVLQRLGREGRSQRILPVLATQRIADVIAKGADMGSYLGRSTIMQIADPVEADAALTLCGLEPTPERRAWLANAGPKRGVRDSALALHRDLKGQCSAMLIGPVSPEIAQLFSTNALDRELRGNSQVEAVSR